MRLRAAITPRDRLEHLLDYVRRAFRYWWVTTGLLVLGGALSVLFAAKKQPQYDSQAVLVYQPKIQSVVLTGRDAETQQRNIGDRYRELLLSRRNLTSIVTDKTISPFPEAALTSKVEEAVEALRLAVSFDSRGANTFRITYTDTDAKRAQKVTARLTDLLIQSETELREVAAHETVNFARKQKASADDELRGRERKYTEFLDKHPEFTQEEDQGGGEGALIRAREKGKVTPKDTGNPRLFALERQADRLRAILATPEGQAPPPPPPTARVRTPDQLAAQQVIDEAQRELTQAKRRLEDARAKFTDKHPDVIKAQEEVSAAEDRVRSAKAAMPADVSIPDPIAPGGQIDRDKLAKDLADLEKRIAAEKARTQGTVPPATADDAKAQAIVNLETEHKDLRRAVAEEKEAVQALADQVFRAEMSANQQTAENNSYLMVVDPAFEPMQPKGKGKKFYVMVGVVLFGGLGAALALGLAILDDRLYRRTDVEKLELAPVLAVIPKARVRRKRT